MFVECWDFDSYLSCPVTYDWAVFLGHPFLEMPAIYTRPLVRLEPYFSTCLFSFSVKTLLFTGTCGVVSEQSLNLQLHTKCSWGWNEWDPSQWLFYGQGMTLTHQWIATPLLVGLSVQIDLRDDPWFSSSQLGHFLSQRGCRFNCSLPNGTPLLPVMLWPNHSFLSRVMCGSGTICFCLLDCKSFVTVKFFT